MTDAAVPTARLASFVRTLRHEGFAVSPDTTRQLVDAAGLVGFEHERDVREAFRAVTVTDVRQRNRFDALFDSFFLGGAIPPLPGPDVPERDASPPARQRVPAERLPDEPDGGWGEEVFEVAGASERERLMGTDFADLGPEEAEAVRRIVAALEWGIASFPSRRWQPAKSGERPDLRRTFRRMMGADRDLMPLARAERRPRQRTLIVIADISGSMERYTEMLLYFVHGARERFRKLEAFVFATRLTRITRQLARRDPRVALDLVSSAATDWSGGTLIGEAIATFNRRWARRVTSGAPIVLIISDGWDTGDPRLLAREMDRLRRAVHGVVWLNPLAGREGFTPEARGLAAALPYVDDLAAGATATDLVELVGLLGSAASRRERSPA